MLYFRLNYLELEKKLLKKAFLGIMLALLLIGMITYLLTVSVHAILTPPFDVLYVSSFYGGSYVKAMNGLMFFIEHSGGGSWISRFGTTFFYALNVSTGTQVWNYSADEWLTINFDSQRVYFGGNKGHLTAVNQKDGSVCWRLNLTGAILANPAVENNTVYVGVTDVIYAISANSGDILWQKTIPSRPREDAKTAEGYGSPPEPGVHTEIISLLSQDHYIYGVITHEKTVVWGRSWARYASSDIFCVDLSSKEIKWLIPSPQYDKGFVGVIADFVFLGNAPMYALNISTGEFLWNLTTDEFGLFPHEISVHQITSDVILVMGRDSTYVNTTNGEIIRKGEPGFFYKNKLYSCRTKLVVINNEVVPRIELREIDCLSGNISWTHTFLDLNEQYASPIIYNDVLFLVCSDRIYALRSSQRAPSLSFLGLDLLTWAIIIGVLTATLGAILMFYKKKHRGILSHISAAIFRLISLN